jgi:hypothetical protein
MTQHIKVEMQPTREVCWPPGQPPRVLLCVCEPYCTLAKTRPSDLLSQIPHGRREKRDLPATAYAGVGMSCVPL